MFDRLAIDRGEGPSEIQGIIDDGKRLNPVVGRYDKVAIQRVIRQNVDQVADARQIRLRKGAPDKPAAIAIWRHGINISLNIGKGQIRNGRASRVVGCTAGVVSRPVKSAPDIHGVSLPVHVKYGSVGRHAPGLQVDLPDGQPWP